MRQIIFREFPSQRRFGVELEVSNNLSKKQIGKIVNEYESIYNDNKKFVKVTSGQEGWAQTKDNNYWHVKFDRTCGETGGFFDNGWEIASFIGSGHQDADHISRLARFLNNAGAQVNLNCGLHIHVEVSDFTEADMGILLSRWLKIEDFLISICHPSRKNNKYCLPLRKRINKTFIYFEQFVKNPIDVWNYFKPFDLNIHNNKEKRVTLNTIGFATSLIVPSFSRKTIELRLPECILDENHVKNWLRFIVNFVEVCKNKNDLPLTFNSATNLSEILIYLGLGEEQEFPILDQDLISTKLWFLRQILNKSQNKKIIKEAQKLVEFITLI